jgi:hypothetical protein
MKPNGSTEKASRHDGSHRRASIGDHPAIVLAGAVWWARMAKPRYQMTEGSTFLVEPSHQVHPGQICPGSMWLPAAVIMVRMVITAARGYDDATR